MLRPSHVIRPTVRASPDMAPLAKSPFIFPQQRVRRSSLPVTPPEPPADFQYFPQTPTAKPQRQDHYYDALPPSPPITPVRSTPVLGMSHPQDVTTNNLQKVTNDRKKQIGKQHASRTSIALPTFYVPRRNRRNSNASKEAASNKSLQRFIAHFTPLTPFKCFTLFALAFTSIYLATRIRNLLLPRHHVKPRFYSGSAGGAWDAVGDYSDKPAWVGGAGRPMAMPDKRMLAGAVGMERDIIRAHPEAVEGEAPARRHAAIAKGVKEDAKVTEKIVEPIATAARIVAEQKWIQEVEAQRARDNEVRERRPKPIVVVEELETPSESIIKEAANGPANPPAVAAPPSPPLYLNRNAMKVRSQVAVPLDSSSYPPDTEPVPSVHPPHDGNGSGEGIDPRAAKRKVMAPPSASDEAAKQRAEDAAAYAKYVPAAPGKKGRTFGKKASHASRPKQPSLEVEESLVNE